MNAARTCPGCESGMQVFFAGTVELDRCMFCGGVWFDRGELEAVTGRALSVEKFPGHTTRRCVYCRVSLETALIGSVPAEVCGSCLGTFLDEGELEELAARKVPLERRAEAAPAKASNELRYTCGGCGQTLNLQDGFVTAGGVSCGRCYGKMDFGGGSPNTAQNKLSVQHAADVTTYSVVEALVDFFF